jgi:DNA-directed RNA polymerase subunit RPC12/RpoP
MPIRFRCAYCNQLMGIGRRKAGTIVRCPRCAGEVIVPAAQPVPAGSEPAGVNPIFEREDFGRDLGAATPAPDRPPAAPLPPPAYLSGGDGESNDPEAISEPAHRGLRRPGIFLPMPILILSVGLLLGIIAVMFALGFLVGRSTAP